MATIERGRLVRLAAAAGLGSVAYGGPAAAQTLAPPGDNAVFPASSSTSIRVGDLNSLVGNLLTPQTGTADGFTFVPSIALQELVTDNVEQQAHPRIADLATFVTPGILVTGQTQRIQGTVSYTPTFQVYAQTSQNDQIAQNFNGGLTMTAVPDTLFLSLRGYGAQQSTSANAGQSNSPLLSSQNRTQTLGGSISPYVTHRFGGDGTATAGVMYTYSQQTGSNNYGAATTVPTLFNQNPLTTNNALLFNSQGQTFGNSTTRTKEEYATYTTGENLGRFNDSIRLDAAQTTGSGVLSNARRTTAIDSVAYGLTRQVALLGSFGYEDISYAGIPPVHIRDAVYTGGFRLTPNQTSSISVTYGHKDGFNAATLAASYQLTARLRVFANYSEGLSTSQQEVQNNLNSTTVDQFGNSVDNATGAPALINDQLLGLQSGLYKLKRASVTAVLSYDLDTFSLNVLNENRTILSVTPGQTGFSDKGTVASFSWSHQFTPVVTGTASVQYGIQQSQTTPVATTHNANLSLSTGYAINETLSASAQYYVSDLSSTLPQQSYLANVVLVGLRKSF